VAADQEEDVENGQKTVSTTERQLGSRRTNTNTLRDTHRQTVSTRRRDEVPAGATDVITRRSLSD